MPIDSAIRYSFDAGGQGAFLANLDPSVLFSVKRRKEYILGHLQEKLLDPMLTLATEVTATSDDELHVRTAIGESYLRFRWGSDDHRLIGLLVLEARHTGLRGQHHWQKDWEVRIFPDRIPTYVFDGNEFGLQGDLAEDAYVLAAKVIAHHTNLAALV